MEKQHASTTPEICRPDFPTCFVPLQRLFLPKNLIHYSPNFEGCNLPAEWQATDGHSVGGNIRNNPILE